MVASIPSAALSGVDAYRVDVEIDVAGGLPQYCVVGLAATSIKEGVSRIRAALRQVERDLPPRRITVNLAPADRRKDGAAFDLPIALGLLCQEGVKRPELLAGLLILGELGLDGTVRPVRGVLAAAALARSEGLRGVLVPHACAAEAAAVDGIEVYAATHLGDVLRALEGECELARYVGVPGPARVVRAHADFRDVRGQRLARRAVEIAVAGGHNVLLYGPPGAGKTMICSRLPSILPAMTRDEAIEVTRIHSAAGLAPGDGLVASRPFRAPHHSCSVPALVGGGLPLRPGEISLAHRGVLFLDELPEFQRSAIEALRQPLEDRAVRIVRAHASAVMPASFLLAASANPCPCGWFGASARSCTCTPGMIERYRARLSGPVLDRIDLQVRVSDVSVEELRAREEGESSLAIRERVSEARARQAQRLEAYGFLVNAELDAVTARATCRLTADAESVLLRLATRRVGMTARAIDRVVRIARTIADLEGADEVRASAVREAATYRLLDVEPLADPRCVLRAMSATDAPVCAGVAGAGVAGAGVAGAGVGAAAEAG